MPTRSRSSTRSADYRGATPPRSIRSGRPGMRKGCRSRSGGPGRDWIMPAPGDRGAVRDHGDRTRHPSGGAVFRPARDPALPVLRDRGNVLRRRHLQRADPGFVATGPIHIEWNYQLPGADQIAGEELVTIWIGVCRRSRRGVVGEAHAAPAPPSALALARPRSSVPRPRRRPRLRSSILGDGRQISRTNLRTRTRTGNAVTGAGTWGAMLLSMWSLAKPKMPEPGEALPGPRGADAGPRAALRQRRAARSRRSRRACELALFGLGCFWGAEKKFWQHPACTARRWATPAAHAEPDVPRGVQRA